MTTIGPLQPSERAAWEELFRGYIAFYERDEPQATYDRAWEEFRRGDRMHALGARVDGVLVGFAHFLTHANTTNPADSCYLQDLYTAPEQRGRGVARALIEAVTTWARDNGCARVHWQTRASNTAARVLYDRVAEHDGFVVYAIRL